MRHIVVCEGESEWVYLQRLQSFLDGLPLPDGSFETPLRFIAPGRVVVKNGSYGKLTSSHNKIRKENRRAPSIQVWTDFDLYHRNDLNCATNYAAKSTGIPDFLFSFHNFEDFFALHWSDARFLAWLAFGNRGHFATPLHAEGYLPEIKSIFSDYAKGSLPVDFVTWQSLRNLKANLVHQPESNPHGLKGLKSFGAFLVSEIERTYPGSLG
ncbi:MAG TPA: hypothetical protein VHD32_05000 [Candidatus Didemnitutus sp.]|nr:hypothetical protein [Candidatus Didemnitutus sp.]